jgi:hypothetical protein
MAKPDTIYTNNQTSTGKYYEPKNKKARAARQRIFNRFRTMRDDPIRKEAEEQWERADKMFRQWMPARDPDDWRSNIALPDGFAAVQAHMQETIDRRSRPTLSAVEHSDEAIEAFNNSIFNFSMDRTGFDHQTILAKQCAAIRGTGFVMEIYRLDKRTVQDPVRIDKEGNIVYQEKEITDFDDTYTKFVENEYIYLDPAGTSANGLRDMIEREILDIDEFKRIYGEREDFIDVDKVCGAGDISENVQYFERAKDIDDDGVEVLHYYNRSTDSYDVLANNILVRMGAIPFKHKELPIAIFYNYWIMGRIYGLGIPEVIYSLTEERKTSRNQVIDRGHLNQDKMFIVNDLVDIDEDEATARPHGFIRVNANGLPLNQVMQPLEYGDTPASYYRNDQMLLEDIRRAHGIDDRIQGVNVGGTATEAAILKESSQRRINLINQMAEMDTLVRLGRLKWSNIQFFYPASRVERITDENGERTKKVVRRIKVNGKSFRIVNDNGENRLSMEDIDGTSTFKLNSSMARYMEGDFDVTVKAAPSSVLSKPIKQAKTIEMLQLLTNNPATQSELEPRKVATRLLEINDEDPKNWLRGSGISEQKMMEMAELENQVMKGGTVLAPTEGATEMHTLMHIHYTETREFEELPPEIQQIFEAHILGEHDQNPNTGSAADMINGANPTPGAEGAGGAGVAIQSADIQPSTVNGGEDTNTNGQDQTVAL